MKKDDMDDDYMIESRLVPIFDIPYSVLRLEDDEYYGSDFIRMAAILRETEKNKPGMADVFCNWSLLKDNSRQRQTLNWSVQTIWMTKAPGLKGLCAIPSWSISLSAMPYMRYAHT